MISSYNLRFPIGESVTPEKFESDLIKSNMRDIAELPNNLRAMVQSVSGEKLNNTYRTNGWSALQVIHHIADSHLNAYCRFKLALTESNPTIKPYEEQEWAKLPDYSLEMVSATLDLIDGLHKKWVYLMLRLDESQWKRTFFHPESQKTVSLFQNAAIYAWHGKHHLKHIEIAIRK